MKTIIITALLLFTAPVLAAPGVLKELSDQGVNYIGMSDNGQLMVSVWDENVDPRTVCEMGDKYPNDNLVKVKNVQTNQTAYCGEPAI